MKKFLLSLAVVLGCVSLATAQTEVFYESFDQCNGTGANDGKGFGTEDATVAQGEFITDNEGWIVTENKSKGAYQAAKFSTSSIVATVTTPALTNLNGDATLTFKAAPWGSKDGTTLTLAIEGGGELSTTSVEMVSEQWTEFTVQITGGTSSSKISFTPAKRFFLDEVKIVGEGGGTVVEKSAAPVISPESQSFSEAVAVTISAAEGAAIYYTLDGTTPTEESDVYAGAPIAVVTTTTVKAIAVEEGKAASAVAEATYTKVAGEYAMSSVLGTAAVGDNLDVAGLVTGLCTGGFVVTDKTGSMFVYMGSGFDTTTYAIGDQVTFSGAVSEYNKGLQFAGSGLTITKWGNETYTYPTPTVVDGAALDAIAAREVSEKAMYAKVSGTIAVSGNYYNLNVEGATASQGSIYYATDELKEKLQNGLTADITGYIVSVSSGKFVNILVTDVKTSGDPVLPAENEVANIAEFIEKGLTDESTVFTIAGEVAVTYHNGANLYIQDETGAILVYNYDGFGTDFRNGERFKGVKGTFKNYYSTYELLPDLTSLVPTSGAAVTPKVYTIETIVPEIQNHYVALENVTLDSANSKLVDVIDAEIAIYNKFKIELPADGEYTVIGLVSLYTPKGAEEAELQFYPVEFTTGSIVPPAEQTAATFAEAIALGESGVTTEITYTGNAQVVYQNNRHLYVKDAETWTLFYCKDIEMPKYNNGDVITGFKMTYTTNDNQPQFLPVAGTFAEGTPGAAVSPVTVTTADINEANYHKYVVLVNVAFSAEAESKTGYATDDAGTATIYATWNNQYSDPQVAFPENGNYDVIGFVSSYNGAFQVLATEFGVAGAVDGVELDANAPIEYYNFQGVRVANPENGMYIRVQGGKATKVILK